MFKIFFILTGSVLLMKNSKFNLFNFKIIKIYLYFNSIFFFFFNYSLSDFSLVFTAIIMITLLLLFSNFEGIAITILIVSCYTNNLILNLILIEFLNLIFFVNLKQNYYNQKSIIIYNFLLSILYLSVCFLFFLPKYGTLNFNYLIKLSDNQISIFILLYLFFKMGGIVGLSYLYFFYKLLDYKLLIPYTTVNFYLYFYLFDLVLNINVYSIYGIFLLPFIIINYIIIFYFFFKIKDSRDFLFLSS